MRVTRETVGTRADRLVVDSSAHGIDTASADARIATFLREAGHIARAVIVDHTLGIDTSGHTVAHTAFAVARAGAWVARIRFCE